MIFSLQRTNPRLATNIKLIIDDKDNMFLETINSTELLERSVYKAYPYNKSLSYGTNIKNFANQFPNKDVLYDIVDETKFNVTDRTSLQYHQIYDYGVYSDASKLIDANYRFFAPIHINKKDTKTPSAFVIFKIPAKNKQVDKSFNKLSDFINYGTLVNVFDLSKIKSIFDGIEDSSVNMQYEQGTITTGLSLDSGLMVSKTESVIDALLANETTITEFENNITNKFREHHLMYSNVINMEFAFNDSSDDKFVRYFGMYVDFNEVTETIAKEYDNMGVIRLLRQQNGYKLYNNTLSLNKYDVIRQSRLANGFGLEKAGEVRLKIVLRPTAGEKLVLKYGNEVEHTIQWNSTNIQSNIITTATWIANELTTKYKGNFTTIRAFVENNNEVVIRSNNTSLSAENLKIEVPNSIQVIQPLYTKETYNNNLIGSGSNTISVNTYFNPKKYNKLQYIDNAGVKKSSDITMVTKYAGDYLYRLKDPILNKDTTPNTVWFLETLTEQPIICSVIQHRDFSFDTTETMYNDVLDFDIVKYKEYLLSIVNDSNFRGRVDELYNNRHPNLPASETELSEYKTNLINNINSYFDNIDLNRSYLYKDIDVFTEEATTTNNEYDRLSENTLPSLSTINKLYPFINKWSYKDGTDVYGNDYRLNISLPFRYESFTPSLESVERDIRYHTHSWLIIGEGRNPYLYVNEQNIRKCLSYSRLPLTRDLLLSKTVDAYTYLKYKTSVREHTSYSKLVWNKEQSACYTYFRGVLLRFDDRTLDDYKFSAILFSQKPVKEDVLTTEWLRNDTHKTLTLIVNFYIPDPILTSLERGEQYYFLDRSLLYFSENIYSTGLNTIDFGTDQISLTLYDNTSPKTYLGNVVTNNWHYTDGGQTLLYVSRGNVNRFNTPLNELLNIGQDFTIDFTSTEDLTNPNYGMQITFKNIQEVKTDHFWCTDILVKNILTRDPDGVDDTNPNDNVIESTEDHNVYQLFKSDPKTFDTNNIVIFQRQLHMRTQHIKRLYQQVVTTQDIENYQQLI
ncbi:hypothetical protein [Tenacibaculum phage PTm5]|uniref:Uncharacterized protein n=1 Tax=Tenacibaculum phage PTm5 TaxID=2547426 RepID=A0A5S9HY44_9CAUD|nr:hypothetical protein [Tenacibaculum phage PTm5]